MAFLVGSNGIHKKGTIVDGIQYLRGLSAVIVVISHCNGIIGKPEYYSRMVMPDWHVASLFAVAAFFSISGFIILIAAMDEHLVPKAPAGEFLRRRFVRIVPFLWLCTIGYNALSWAGTSRLEWDLALRTLIVWPIGELKPNVAWSLRHELLFYGVFAWALLGSRRRPAILIAWFVASAAFYFLSYDLGWAADVTQQPWFEVLKVVMGGDHGANFQFAIGMTVAWLFLTRPHLLPIGQVPAVTMISLMAASCLIVTLLPEQYGLGISALWTALTAPILLCAVCARPACGWLGKAGLVLGNASFAIYLVHNPIVLVLLAIAAKVHLPLGSPLALAAFLIACVVLAVTGGIVVHYLAETPLIRIVNQWSRGQRPIPCFDEPTQR